MHRFSLNKTTILLILTTLLSVIYFSWDINSWRFSYVGDEWPFYAFAEQLLRNHFFNNPFSFEGVFGQNAVISSMYQAIFIQLLGHSNFAWRLSNIILIVPLSYFFYLWVMEQFGKTPALYATILLQTSAYLANFFKIGKNMPQALFLLIACLYATMRCSSSGKKINYFFLGVLFGFSFYFYIGPLFPLIVWPYLFTRNKKNIGTKLLSIAAGYCLLLIPLLLQLHTLNGPLHKTFIGKEYEENIMALINVGQMFLLFFHNADYFYNQFVFGPYFDLASRILIIVGVVVIMRLFFKNIKTINSSTRKEIGSIIRLLLSYISACIVIGITIPYYYVPSTRGIFLIPFGAVFAGIGLAFFNRYVYNYYIAGLLLLIAIINFYQSQIGVFRQTGYASTALLVRDLQLEKRIPTHSNLYLLISDNFKYNVKNISYIEEAYGLQSVPLYIYRTDHPSCANLKSGKVYLFSNDKSTLHYLQKLQCANNLHVEFKILNGKLEI